MSGCKTLVVLRFKFPTIFNLSYERELLKNVEAVALLFNSTFGQKFIPMPANATLVKELVNECARHLLALKVIGSSSRGQDQIYWMSAKNRPSNGEPIYEFNDIKLLEWVKFSISHLLK
ncbi:hypothetical protein Nepgr_030829 [Nepenthes gracilis]|uniref:Uncharacterized protein n=1 Tax=Nepenthes gracilis TaxID=150966 RepID=A0AAD3THC2_NEPGR|nr:hypothetical protein Nepgr_030829 [Nepenthes gracilis]